MERPSDLPRLLFLLSDPTTPHTAQELWCRLRSGTWNDYLPILEQQLRLGTPDVQRLVMSILVEDAEQMGVEETLPFVPLVIEKLQHDDRLVRIAAISAINSISPYDEDTQEKLHQVVLNDEPLIAREALIVLMQSDPDYLKRTLLVLREGSSLL